MKTRISLVFVALVAALTIIPAVASAVLVVAAERWWLRTGLFRSASYWATMTICAFFMAAISASFLLKSPFTEARPAPSICAAS